MLYLHLVKNYISDVFNDYIADLKPFSLTEVGKIQYLQLIFLGI